MWLETVLQTLVTNELLSPALATALIISPILSFTSRDQQHQGILWLRRNSRSASGQFSLTLDAVLRMDVDDKLAPNVGAQSGHGEKVRNVGAYITLLEPSIH